MTWDEMTTAAARQESIEAAPTFIVARDLTLVSLAIAVIVLGLKRLRQAVANEDTRQADLAAELVALKAYLQRQHEQHSREISELRSAYHEMHLAYAVCESHRTEQAKELQEIRQMLEKRTP